MTQKHRTLLIVVGSAVGLLIVLIMGFAIFQPVKVIPRLGLAPGYTLTDQAGARLTSEDMRGAVTLYTFGYTHCRTGCFPTDSLFRAVQDRLDELELGDMRVRFLTVSFDPDRDTPTVLTEAARRAGADPGLWTFATGEAAALKTLIGTGFEIYYGPHPEEPDAFEYRPGIFIVDGNGILRREYRWGMPAVDGLLGDLRVLAREVNAAEGAERLAYEAAHLFACYSN